MQEEIKLIPSVFILFGSLSVNTDIVIGVGNTAGFMTNIILMQNVFKRCRLP